MASGVAAGRDGHVHLAWGQARREGIPGVGAGTVWFDDLDEALTAHRAGTPVVALDLTRRQTANAAPRLG